MDKVRETHLAALNEALAQLSVSQLEVLTGIVGGFGLELEAKVDASSDFATEAFAERFGDLLLIHHALSRESFSKDKFEHGLETVLRRVDTPATLAPRGNPGHDITVHDESWSLKTQADRDIKPDRIHISKFMELGRGEWAAETDLAGLRERMFTHMQSYDRIFTLRTLSAARAAARDPFHHYELVEIPKALLLRAANVDCVMHQDSKQTPKPGSCTVTENGDVLVQLYFDGGTERKLQIKHLAKSACRVHATWRFPRVAPPA